MSLTFRVDDGDLYINEGTGKGELIEGRKKAAQDIARVLLLNYSPSDNDGTELLELNITGGLFTSAVATQAIQTAIVRLQAKQRQDPYSTSQERIVKISDLRTRTLDDGTFIFYLICQTEAGETVAEIINTDTRPVQLNQLLADSAYLK